MLLPTSGDIWARLIQTWDRIVMEISADHVVAAALILVAAEAVRRLISTALLRRIRRWSGHPTNPHSDAIIAALTPPVRFIPIVLAFFIISELITDNSQIAAILSKINRSLVVLTIFWSLFRLVVKSHLIIHGGVKIFTEAMISWAVRVAKILIVALGSAAILEIWGIKVGAILAGLGLFGVAVALGAQDLFKNLIAGIFIMVEQRFQNGDWILADGVVEGFVENIGLRTTKVRRFDKAPVYVPNSQLADNAVTNYSQMTYRRISWIVGLEYRTSIDQLRRIRDDIENRILTNNDFAHPPEVPTFVRVDKFNDSSIDLLVYCFTRTTDWGEWLKIKESLSFAIKDIVERAGSGFAFPSRSLYVEAMPVGTELFPLQKPVVASTANTGSQTATT